MMVGHLKCDRASEGESEGMKWSRVGEGGASLIEGRRARETENMIVVY